MTKHLVLAGGGHAHLTTLKKLRTFIDAGHKVTVINPSAYQYYSGMGPGMLGGTYRPQETRFNIRRMSENGGAVFVEDFVTHIDAVGRRLLLASGNTISYDVASFNIGSDVPASAIDAAASNSYTVKPIVNLLYAREQITSGTGPLDAVVAGGGPAGAEIAGNLLDVMKEAGRMGSVTLIAGRALMRGFPHRVRTLVRKVLSDKGIRIIEGAHITSVEDHILGITTGDTLKADIILLALGVRPSAIFRESGIPTGPDGGMLVNYHLQSTVHPELFGGGDCVSLEGMPLAKVGVYAIRQNDVLLNNLMAAVNGTDFQRFKPGSDKFLLAFNLGSGHGVFSKGPISFDSKLAFVIKDRIDRGLMKEFQVSGELSEPA